MSSSPDSFLLLASAPDEIDEVFRLCCSLIQNPPENYKVVKQAIQALMYLTTGKPEIVPAVLAQLLHVIQKHTRSNPRRWAVRSLGTLAAHDPSIVYQVMDLLILLLSRQNEQSQYVRKAAFCALSRIGRKYPHLQPQIIPLFFQHYRNPRSQISTVWGALIGLGRMSQSSALLRSQMAPEWLSIAEDHRRHFRLRWACLKALGHGVCPVGNVDSDPLLEERVFEVCKAELDPKPTENLSPDPFIEAECYLVQYPAAQALGLLLRSQPDKWWPRISPIFAIILQNKRFAAIVKSAVILNFGKLSFFSQPTNPFFKPILNVLFSLAQHSYILVSEPAIFALTNFSLTHPNYNNLYLRTRLLLLKNLFPNNPPSSPVSPNISSVPFEILEYFLATWGRHVSRNYVPNIADCSSVVAIETHGQASLPPRLTSLVTAAMATAVLKGGVKSTAAVESSYVEEYAQSTVTKVDERGDFLEEEEISESDPHNRAQESLIINQEIEKVKQEFGLESSDTVEIPVVSDESPITEIHNILEERLVTEGDDEKEKEDVEESKKQSNLIAEVFESSTDLLKPEEEEETSLETQNVEQEVVKKDEKIEEENNEEEEKEEKVEEMKEEIVQSKSTEVVEHMIEAEKVSESPVKSSKVSSFIEDDDDSMFDAWNNPTPSSTTVEPQPIKKPIKKAQKKKKSVDQVKEPVAQLPITTPPTPSVPPTDSDDSSDEEGPKSFSLGSLIGGNSDPDHVISESRTIGKSLAPVAGKPARKKPRKSPDSDQSSLKQQPKPLVVTVQTSKADKVCKFYEVGMCRKGSACPFKHVGMSLVAEPCRFFMSGTCNRGSACPYIHDAKLAPCFKLFIDGKCEEGDECRFTHDEKVWELHEKRRVLREQMKWDARVAEAIARGEEPPVVPPLEEVRPPAYKK
ncbi:hypothetical protein RCL1_002985 [Eukaryota sp. TZLM3-RCL]